MYERKDKNNLKTNIKSIASPKVRKRTLMASDTMDRDFGISSSCYQLFFFFPHY